MDNQTNGLRNACADMPGSTNDVKVNKVRIVEWFK